MGILDSTCLRTVTGKTWLNVFLDILMDKEKRLIKYFTTNTKFKFGDSGS